MRGALLAGNRRPIGRRSRLGPRAARAARRAPAYPATCRAVGPPGPPAAYCTPRSLGLRKASRSAGVTGKFRFTLRGGIGLMNQRL